MTAKDMREALEAAEGFISDICPDDLRLSEIEERRTVLAKIDAALSAVPAPVSEEEDDRELFERVYDAVYEANGSKLDDGASVLCVLRWMLRDDPRLSRTEGEWRPIETAPRDGTIILLGNVGSEPRAAYWGLAPRAFGGNACERFPWVFLDATNCVNQMTADDTGPTHWMPLPSPPGAQQPAPEESIRTRLDDQHVKSSGGVRTSTGKE